MHESINMDIITNQISSPEGETIVFCRVRRIHVYLLTYGINHAIVVWLAYPMVPIIGGLIRVGES